MIEHNTLVSIIVPVYGTQAYLPACIDSLCVQSYSNIQIILVDDESQDECPEICDAYARKDSRITVIHQKNKGVSGARNAGMRRVAGDYVMFVDSDDELLPNAVEILLQDAQKYGADIVSATKSIVDEKGEITNSDEDGSCTVYRDDKPLLLSLDGDQNTEAVWAKLFKSTFIKDVCFEEGKNINEDGFFMFQCYIKKPILVQHNISVYLYGIRQNSCSRQVFSDKYLSMIYFCDRKKEIIAKQYPKYMDKVYNMEVRTRLFLLDLLCSTSDKKYRELQTMCIKTVKKLYDHHRPINGHHKKLAWIVSHGLYKFYKIAVRVKYYR